MRAAVYARYSSAKQRESSIEDQVRNCTAFAEREGWSIAEHYVDEALSGTSKDRPGFKRLLAHGEEGGFDVLLVDDLSRLSRDEIELKQLVRRFKYRGLRIIGVSDGFDSASKGHKIQVSVRAMMNEIYLDDLREKTHRGLTGQALKGNNCGGRSYGYQHVPELDPHKTDDYGRPVVTAVRREVDSDQARWVRKIFAWYADGHSPRWIASELNRLGVPSLRGGTWATSVIYGDMTKGTGLLNNQLYMGRFVWNRSQWVKDPDTGKRKRVPRPKDEWIVTEMPELRIVPQELWDRVKARQAEQRAKSEHIRKALHENARTGAGPKYLFSGLLKCAECGANYVQADSYRYACSNHVNRGEAVCANSLKVPRKVVEARLLEGIKRDLFTEEALELFKRETSRLLTEQRSRPETGRLKKRLAAAEKEIGNIMAAIKAGILTPTTKAELEAVETEKAELERQLEQEAQALEKVAQVLPRAVDRYGDLVANLEEAIAADVPRARTQVQALLGDKITLHPTDDGYLEAEVVGDYAGFMSLAAKRPGTMAGASEISVVAGAGFVQDPTMLELRKAV